MHYICDTLDISKTLVQQYQTIFDTEWACVLTAFIPFGLLKCTKVSLWLKVCDFDHKL